MEGSPNLVCRGFSEVRPQYPGQMYRRQHLGPMPQAHPFTRFRIVARVPPSILICSADSGRISSRRICGALDRLRCVARDETVLYGLLKGPVQRHVDVLDGPGREAGPQLLTVQAANVRRGHALELHGSQYRA